MTEIKVKVHAEQGCFWGEVVDLPGCFASGDSLPELEDALNEAIAFYLSDEPGSAPVIEPGSLGIDLSEVLTVPVAR